MRLFLDSSVLIAASVSESGASRALFVGAAKHRWELLATPYVVGEVRANIGQFPVTVEAQLDRLLGDLVLVDDVLTMDRAVVFEPAKDRPVLFSALAWADLLLTLDREHFGPLIGGSFYGLSVLTPGMFLASERSAGRWSE